MTKLTHIKTLSLVLLLSAGGLLLHYTLSGKPQEADDDRFSEKVNLALRRTAHHLLLVSGDSTGRIAPVEKTGDATWEVRLERAFSYDSLPAILQTSFDLHGIDKNFDVAVYNCADRILELGYHNLDYLTTHEVPCAGREQKGDCYRLQVSFAIAAPPPGQNRAGFWLAIGCLLAGLAMLAWKEKKKRRPAAESILLVFGNSSLDAANRQLVSGGVKYELTYRETKLLQLFGSRPNSLLEREFILQSVWADEGVLVGRSVDMFVSRLRKMLRSDPTVRIATVHGVGYRLETA
jgi:hypothetical protein